MEKTPIQMLAAGGIVSGWLIATMVWTIHELETSKLSLVFLATYLGGIGDFPHVVVGSIKVAYLLFMAEARAPEALFTFLIPVTLGNIVGGTAIFALVSRLEVRADENEAALGLIGNGTVQLRVRKVTRTTDIGPDPVGELAAENRHAPQRGQKPVRPQIQTVCQGQSAV